MTPPAEAAPAPESSLRRAPAAAAAPRTVFLTGATGFIGGRLAALLAGRGDRLRCLVRASSRTEALEALGAELVEGTLDDGPLLAAALDGVDLAYHLAASYDLGVVDARAMARVNVDGTRTFFGAVREAEPPRAVYVSSTVALGPVGAEEGDERTRHVGDYASAYERTKTEAHRLAEEAQRIGLPVVIACPANVYGPGDEGPNGRFVRDLVRGRVPGLLTDPSVFSYVHVDDVAEGLLAIGERGRIGETYVLSGEPATINDFALRVAAEAGRRPPRLRLPPRLARGAGVVLDAVTRVTRLRFQISRENVDTVAGRRYVHSHAKATRELGWEPRSLDRGLPDTVAWARRRAGR